MTKHLVSVGLPVVKSNFLVKSLERCLNQTYNNIEILVQNNAADDQVKEDIRKIVEQYNDKRIKYYETNTQLPMVQNWNATFERANGEFFALLSDDDTWEPTFLEVIMDLAHKYPKTNIFHTRLAIINDQDEVLRLSPTCPEYEDALDLIIHRLLKIRVMYLSDFVVRTNSLRSIGGFIDFPDGWGSDIFTWFKIALDGGVGYSNKVLFNYRDSVINVSNSTRYKNKRMAIRKQYQMLKDIEANLDGSTEKYEIAKKRMLSAEIAKFLDKEKKYIVYMMLKNKYKLSMPIAMGIATFYQYFVRTKESKKARD